VQVLREVVLMCFVCIGLLSCAGGVCASACAADVGQACGGELRAPQPLEQPAGPE
jgi:hypothetical protein